MKKLLALFFCLLCSINWSTAQQHNLGFGIRTGAANFLGDIGSGDVARGFIYNMELKDTRNAVGTFTRFRFHPLFAVQASFDWNRIQGTDDDSDSRSRQGRNLSFVNDLMHLSTKFEFYPQVLAVSDVGYRGRYRLDYQTYFFSGLGAVYNNPKAEYEGQKVKLRKLMTEGVSYSPVALTIPFGGGFFFTYKKVHRFGFEYVWNLTFTDYLDDISTVYADPATMSGDPLAPILANRYDGNGDIPGWEQYEPGSPRGNATDKDNFMSMTISYSYLIRTRGSFYRDNYSWMYGRKKRWGGTRAKF